LELYGFEWMERERERERERKEIRERDTERRRRNRTDDSTRERKMRFGDFRPAIGRVHYGERRKVLKLHQNSS